MRAGGFLLDVVRMAARDLAGRPLRAALSLVSFSSSIGIAVVLVACGDGLQNAVRDILRNFGEGQIVVTPGRTTGVGGQRRAGRTVRFRYEDVEGIASRMPSIT